MADMTLRAYVKEIDELVEQEQLDEAIAHCRHILEGYPKHVDTYRVLGKAYLEAKRFGDAADIFQRVLSAIPDDFVAHIGMAIVREDEGNLDAAIWHIERAFETNPANPAIQQELRRLIGRRDGLEPHKVRMTRGALARMYAHGELYDQAIAELNSALQDDPDRPDLEVLLATMYWKTDQHVEAAEVSNRILEKLPYCREANRIMAAILQSSNKTEEASTYHRRLAALDPYLAYVETADIDPQTVDANSIRLEKIAWRPGQPMPTVEPGQPEWAASLGVELSTEEPEEREIIERPSWLEELEKPSEPIEAIPDFGERAEIEPSIDVEPAAETEIPEWMREAGWQEATGEVAETPVTFTDEELAALDEGEPLEEGEITPADIPGWIQDIAPPTPQVTMPAESPQAVEETVSPEDEELSEWLREFDEGVEEIETLPEELVSEEAEIPIEDILTEGELEEPIPEIGEPALEEEADGLPTWLESETPGATTTIVTWLGERRAKEEIPAEELPAELGEPTSPEPVDEVVVEPKEEIPAWLDDLELEPEGEAPSEAELEEEEAPSWLAGIAEVAAQQDQQLPVEEETPLEEAPPISSTEEAPEWLQAITEPTPETPFEEIPPEEEAPDWLEGIAVQEAETPPESLIPTHEAPEWLRGIAEPDSEKAELEEPTAAEKAPEWLAGIAEPEVEAVSETPTPSVEAPEWLQEFAAAAEEEPEPIEEPQILDELEEIEAETYVGEIEEALAEEAEPTPAFEAETVIAGIEPEHPADVISGEELDDDEVLGWLEGLAARQGADEELISEVEEPISEVPTGLEVSIEAPLDEEKEIPEEPKESLEWLERLATERGIDVDLTSPVAEKPIEAEEPEAPAWLESMATQPIPEGFQPELEEEIPDWLQQAEEITEEEIEVEVPPLEEAPPAAELEPEIAPPPEPIPVEAEVESAPEAPSPPEPIPSEPMAEVKPELEVEPEAPPIIEPIPVETISAEEIELPAPDEPIIAEPEAEVEAEAPPTHEPITIEPEAEMEPDVVPPVEPFPVEIISDVEAEPPSPPEPSPTPPELEVEPETLPPVEPIPVDIGPAVRLEPEVAEEPPLAEPVPIETIEEVKPEVAPPVEPVPMAPVAEVEPPVEPPPVAEEPPPPPEPPKPVKPELDPGQLLDSARQALASDDTNRAVAEYKKLIKKRLEVKTVIEDLRTALERDPNQPDLWQVLGDAYMENDQLTDAIQAYQRGMEVA